MFWDKGRQCFGIRGASALGSGAPNVSGLGRQCFGIRGANVLGLGAPVLWVQGPPMFRDYIGAPMFWDWSANVLAPVFWE